MVTDFIDSLRSALRCFGRRQGVPQEGGKGMRFGRIYLEITNVCNRSCAFCPKTKRPQTFLEPAQFTFLAERLRPYTEYLYFHLMGEPLLHPSLDFFLREAERLGFRVVLTTNGTLLPARQTLLLQSPALHKVNISLHSFEANDGGCMDDYLRGCTQFARAASERGVRCTFRLWNLDGAQAGLHAQNPEILAALHTAFPAPWVANTRGYRLRDRLFLEWAERFDWPDPNAPELASAISCRGLRDQLGVLCDGTVVPCCLDGEGEMALGNLFFQPLSEILQSPRAQAICAGFSHGAAAEPLCRRCGYARRFATRRTRI